MTDLQLNSMCQHLEFFLAFYLEQEDPYSYGAVCFIQHLLGKIYNDEF